MRRSENQRSSNDRELMIQRFRDEVRLIADEVCSKLSPHNVIIFHGKEEFIKTVYEQCDGLVTYFELFDELDLHMICYEEYNSALARRFATLAF